MNFGDGSNGDDRRESEAGSSGGAHKSPASRKKRAPSNEVGNALKSAYERTLDEDIPPEMLDLLGKLG